MSITAAADTVSSSAGDIAARSIPVSPAVMSDVLTATLPAPADLISLSPAATQRLVLEAVHQLDRLLGHADRIVDADRAPTPAAIATHADEIAIAAEWLIAQVPRPVVAPPKPDGYADGQSPDTPHRHVVVPVRHEQRLRDDAAAALNRATDALDRMQPFLSAAPVEAAILRASIARVARACATLVGPLDHQDGRAWQPVAPAIVLMLVVLLATSRVDLHGARITAGGLAMLWIAVRLWRRHARRPGLRIELRR